MKNKFSLTEQLLYICILIIGIIVISLGIILPKTLLPIYEENLYNYLKQPLTFLDSPDNNKINSEVAYIYTNDTYNTITISENINEILDINNIEKLLNKFTEKYGKIKYNKKTYYYYAVETSNEKRIAITDNKYILEMKKNIFTMIIIIVGITYIIVSLIILTWSNKLVNRIKKLKEKIDNIDNDDYSHQITENYDDELHTLDLAIENMRTFLKENELYKNRMYQNISHDFKTPITVMKSYIEASEDGIETQEQAIEVIKEQLTKLENKVHSLLYLNKLNYIKDQKENLNVNYDISTIVNNSIEKFKIARKDVDFILEIDNNTIFRGSSDMWEAIIDNILNNFIRYANKTIKITIKNNKIIFFNDGPNIDENILNSIFTPYEKGIKGVFGLGLSVVKKTLQFLKYDITIENVKNGVKFIIK